MNSTIAPPMTLLEIQHPSKQAGGWVGANVRIMKGVTLTGGTFSSRPGDLPVEIATKDSGRLFRTNQRLVFLGAVSQIEVATKTIISLDYADGRLDVYVHGREPPTSSLTTQLDDRRSRL